MVRFSKYIIIFLLLSKVVALNYNQFCPYFNDFWIYMFTRGLYIYIYILVIILEKWLVKFVYEREIYLFKQLKNESVAKNILNKSNKLAT